MQGSSFEEILATISVMTPEYRDMLEKQVLGYMARSGEDARFLLRVLKEDYFSNPEHKKLFALIKEKADASPESISLADVALEAHRLGLSVSQSLIDYSYGLQDKSVALKLANRLKEEALHDQVSKTLVELTAKEKPLRSLLKELKGVFVSVEKELTENLETVHINDDVARAFLLSVMEQGGPEFRLGLQHVDKHMVDLARGNMIIIGARPAVGKTAFALFSAFQNAKAGVKTHFISMEMTKKQILARLFSIITGYEPRAILKGLVPVEELETKIIQNPDFERIKENLLITFGSMRLEELISVIETSIVKNGTELFYIDYVQLIGAYGRSRREEIITISKALRQLALENNVAIVALSQLRRLGGKSQYEEPTMEDLKEAGELEQDASLILLLYKTDYLSTDTEYSLKLKVAKQRNGPSGMEYDILARLAGIGFTPINIKKDEDENKREETVTKGAVEELISEKDGEELS